MNKYLCVKCESQAILNRQAGAKDSKVKDQNSLGTWHCPSCKTKVSVKRVKA